MSKGIIRINSVFLILALLLSIAFCGIAVFALEPEDVTNATVTDEYGRQITVEYYQPTGQWQALANGSETIYTGLASNKYGLWYCQTGRVDFSYNGFATLEGETWYVEDGKVDTSFSGDIERGDKVYTFERGKMIAEDHTKKAKLQVYGFLLALAAAIVLFIFHRKNVKRKAREQREREIALSKEAEETIRQEKIEKAKNIYKEEIEGANLSFTKAEFLTGREKEFYPHLKAVADKLGYTVSMKPRLGDIVTGADNEFSSQGMKERNKVWKKHVDFALFDPTDMELKLIIELDDTTHEKQNRVNRDYFVDKVLESTGYIILHVYDEKNLEEAIRAKLNKEDEGEASS